MSIKRVLDTWDDLWKKEKANVKETYTEKW